MSSETNFTEAAKQIANENRARLWLTVVSATTATVIIAAAIVIAIHYAIDADHAIQASRLTNCLDNKPLYEAVNGLLRAAHRAPIVIQSCIRKISLDH